MDFLAIALVLGVGFVIVWGLEQVSKRKRHSSPHNLPERRTYTKADDWFDDAKAYHPPRPGIR